VNELGIELGANELLLPTMKTEVICVPRQFIHLSLPHINKLGKGQVMSMHVSVLVDSVGPPSAEVCRTAASFP
jgi:hypothetical protein